MDANHHTRETKMIPVNYGFRVGVIIHRDEVEDTATVEVIAPMYINKSWFMSHSYKSSQFSDGAIIRDSDFIRALSNAYGKN